MAGTSSLEHGAQNVADRTLSNPLSRPLGRLADRQYQVLHDNGRFGQGGWPGSDRFGQALVRDKSGPVPRCIGYLDRSIETHEGDVRV